MAQLGEGNGAGYPAVVDTTQIWANSASSGPDGPTRADAELVNDFAAAIIAIETELGADPAGAFASVRARLDQLAISIQSPGALLGLPFADSSGAVAITPTNGSIQYTATTLSAGILLFGVVAYVTTTLGNANGLTTFSLGFDTNADAWGSGIARAATTASGPAQWVAYGGASTSATTRTIVVTADAGSFDGTGEIIVTYAGLTIIPFQAVP